MKDFTVEVGVMKERYSLAAFSAAFLAIAIGCGGGGSTPGSTTGGTTGSSTGTTTAGSTGSTTSSTTGATTSSTTGSTTGSPGVPALGADASLNGKQAFPANNPWNTAIDTMPVDPNSDPIITSIGKTTHLHPDFGSNPNYGIPYIVVAGTQTPVAMHWTAYGSESDPGPYPVPPTAPIEGGSSSGGDRHVIVIDRDHWKLYELGYGFPQSDGSWDANCGATWDLNSNALRTAGWTSADAAGLPIFPGLIRFDEIKAGVITHAIRFTVQHSRHGYISPARHYASSLTGTQYPPMGMRVRLKSSFPISGFGPQATIILRAMKKYGMIVADNGSNWYFQGAPSKAGDWDDNDLDGLKNITGDSFEVVQMGTVTTN